MMLGNIDSRAAFDAPACPCSGDAAARIESLPCRRLHSSCRCAMASAGPGIAAPLISIPASVASCPLLASTHAWQEPGASWQALRRARSRASAAMIRDSSERTPPGHVRRTCRRHPRPPRDRRWPPDGAQALPRRCARAGSTCSPGRPPWPAHGGLPNLNEQDLGPTVPMAATARPCSEGPDGRQSASTRADDVAELLWSLAGHQAVDTRPPRRRCWRCSSAASITCPGGQAAAL